MLHVLEMIIDHKGSAQTRRFLVRWQGHPPSMDTWEPASSFVHFPAVLDRYVRQHLGSRASASDRRSGLSVTAPALAPPRRTLLSRAAPRVGTQARTQTPGEDSGPLQSVMAEVAHLRTSLQAQELELAALREEMATMQLSQREPVAPVSDHHAPPLPASDSCKLVVSGLAGSVRGCTQITAAFTAFCRGPLRMPSPPSFKVVSTFDARQGAAGGAVLRFQSTADVRRIMEAKTTYLDARCAISIDRNRPRAEREARQTARALHLGPPSRRASTLTAPGSYPRATRTPPSLSCSRLNPHAPAFVPSLRRLVTAVAPASPVATMAPADTPT